MNTKTFSIRAVLSRAWELFKQRPMFFLVIPLVPAVLSSLISSGGSLMTGGLSELVKQYPDNSTLTVATVVLSAVAQFIGWAVSMLVGVGLQAVFLDTVAGKKKKFADLFAYKHIVIPYLLASVVVGLVMIPALFAFIIPGIIWALATQFYTFAILTPGTGPIESIKESMRVTKGARMKLFLLSIVLTGVNILGVFCLFVGVFVTIPVTGLAAAAAYLTLKEQTVAVKAT